METLAEPSLALGVADAFVTLREAGKLKLEILEILPPRLRKLLPGRASLALQGIDSLPRDSCYNEYQKAIDSAHSGGDYCDFFPVSPNRYGLIIIDVSGHEERAFRLRNLLVQVISKMAERSDPARTSSALNRFALQYPFPEDVFVSMVYGIIDPKESNFCYANAGHHPPPIRSGRSISTVWRRRAVESILAAVRDQGFQIEDDIAIQVYRHV